jgi:hypothetical protein
MPNRISTLADFQLEHDSFGKLVLVLSDGTRHVGVTPIRAFPISDPQHGLAITSVEGRELAWVDDVSQLPPAVWKTLQAELKQREFVPQIQRIIRTSVQTEPCEWEVETDRGHTKFIVKTEDDVRTLGNHKALVIDAHGIRYLIPDTTALDRHSRRILERYL